MEGENWNGYPAMRYSMDHAGTWETSVMLFAHEERVCMDELKDQMAATGRTNQEKMQVKEPEGISGWNPLKYASNQLGRKIVLFCAERIGKKAVDILNGRSEPPKKADKAFLDNSELTNWK